MRTDPPTLLSDSNLSYVWCRALLHATAHPDPSPCIVSLDGFINSQPVEDPNVRRAVDAALAANDMVPINDNAAMIFPFRTWNLARQEGRQRLFDRYRRILDRLRRRAPRTIPYGTYFERMIAFVGAKKGQAKTVNQLDHILSIWDRDRANGRRPRLSALQVSCLDPAKDHTGQPVRGFPCLQQVSFVYDDDEGLAVNAYYPSQYIFDRGYGNYLGLCRLGEFMAYEMGLNLVRLNCYVNAPIRGNITRAVLRSLEATAQQVLKQEPTLCGIS